MTSDNELEQFILQKDNIPILEHIIEENRKIFVPMYEKKQAKKLDFGKPISKQELKEQVPKVFEEVEEFLDVTVKAPKFGFNSIFYPLPHFLFAGFSLGLGATLTGLVIAGHVAESPELETIGLIASGLAGYKGTNEIKKAQNTLYYDQYSTIIFEKDIVETDIPAAAGHEFAHHVQKVKAEDLSVRTLREGHACAIEKHIGTKYALETGNDAFAVERLLKFEEGMEQFYAKACLQANKPVNEKILGYKGSFKTSYLSDENRVKKLKFDQYDIGAAVFALLEAQHGKEIYKKALEKDFIKTYLES